MSEQAGEPAGVGSSRLSRAPRRGVALSVLAALAYLPALASSPGRMPADSKLYVYLDPGRFFGDAASTFDPRQFGGWVPHQHMSYLWPTDPWFWTFDRLGVPDWVAHRLWIGSLLFSAGAGVWWLARRALGLSVAAAVTAGVVYQTSIYILPYISRTSVMLLPWAGLGWIIALTARGLTRRGWREPALIALVVFTVGGVNAAALALIVPGPVLWLVHAVRNRLAVWGDVWRLSWRTGVLSLGVSMWWVVMLMIQGRYGADVLAYSESLADVSYTSTAPEVMRGLGYWLFYIRDYYSPATTSSLRYLVSTAAILLSFGVTVVALVGLATTRWVHRSFALGLVAVGTVLAVGVHPINDRSPLVQLLTGGGDGGLALALRSSTRALPLFVLGLGLGFASIVAAAERSTFKIGRIRWRADLVAATVVVLIVLANNPTLVRARLVDPAIDRDESPPAAWIDAAAAIDDSAATGRVLQLPGIEFGAFRWGYTVDQPLPALTNAGLVTRDLLPLGSPPTMDLLYALDDRVQDGVLESGSVAPVARLLGVDTVWLTNDVEYERFGITRPQRLEPVLDDAPGLGDATTFGPLEAYRTNVAMIQPDTLARPDTPTEAVALYPVEDRRPNDRITDALVVVSGSGAGVVDTAAAGLIDGLEPIIYSADVDLASFDTIDRLIVTDSNRDQARQWRSSQDVLGFTESGGPAQDVLRPVASDRRLDLFESTDPATQTVAFQEGPVRAAATAYGEPFHYLPEHRPFMAIDGDRSTSWTVGDHGNPIGEVLQLTFEHPLTADTALAFTQAGRADDRIITQATFQARSKEGRVIDTWVVDFDPSSRSAPGHDVVVPADAASLTIEIDEVDAGIPFTPSAVAGVGFAEITHPLGATIEVVRVPTDGVDGLDAAADSNTATVSVDYVFTRWRADQFDRFRSDPERQLTREFTVRNRRLTPTATVRLDPRASDDALQQLFGLPITASGHLLGSIDSSAAAAIDGDPTTTWITPFDEAVGSRLSMTTTQPTASLEIAQPLTGLSPITAVTLRVGTDERRVDLRPDAQGLATVTLDPPLPPGELVVTIAAIDAVSTFDRRFGDPTTVPAAIAEIRGPSLPSAPPASEWSYRRECVAVADIGGDTVSTTLELAPGTPFDNALASTTCSPALDLDGVVRLSPSAELPAGLQLDRVVLLDETPPRRSSVSTVPRTGGNAEHRATVTACPAGCWLLDDEAANNGWAATDGTDSLAALPLAGSGQAWRLGPSSEPRTVTVRWTVQRRFTAALVISLATALLCCVLAFKRPRAAEPAPITPAPPTWVERGLRGRRLGQVAPVDMVRAAVVGATIAGLLVRPIWAVPGAIVAVLAVVFGRRLIDTVAIAILGLAATAIAWEERRTLILPDGGWPHHFESWHHVVMFAVALLAMAAFWPSAGNDHDENRRLEQGRRRPRLARR